MLTFVKMYMPYYKAMFYQTKLAREQWPLLCQGSEPEVTLLCVASTKEVLPTLLAAQLGDSVASYLLDPMELNTAIKQVISTQRTSASHLLPAYAATAQSRVAAISLPQFSFIFDGPLVVSCNAEIAPQVAKELQTYRLRGEMCVLRLLAISELGSVPYLDYLGEILSLSPAPHTETCDAGAYSQTLLSSWFVQDCL